jgi:hypothetical protein
MKSIVLSIIACLAVTSVNCRRSKDSSNFIIDDPIARMHKDYPDDEKEKWIHFDDKNLTDQ